MATKKKKETILVVDDNLDTLEVLQRNLTSGGYRVYTASSVAEGIKLLETLPVDLAVTDYKMPEADGLDLVRYVRENCRDTEVMMITGFATVEGAVRAVKTGAEEYLAKPFTDEELFSAVERTLGKLKMRKSTRQDKTKEELGRYGIIGQSEPMMDVFRVIKKTSSTSATVLISGESGTGKELIARAIHYNSPRAQSPFIPVNCGAIPENLLESELFGHVKGAFTGASTSRAGFFQTADRGTVFLDEISDTGPAMQSKLLRALEEKEIRMVGSSRPVLVDVRIVAATNQDLPAMVKKGLFREDLYYRLNVINISVPPLRDRGDDVLTLARAFAEKFSREFNQPVPAFSGEVLQIFRGYQWPGNVRELENLVQRLVVMSDSPAIEMPDLPVGMRYAGPRGMGLNRTLKEVEADHIHNVLAGVGGNKTRAAQILGIDRKTLRNKLNEMEQEETG